MQRFLHRSTQRSKADYSVSDGQTVRADAQCGLLHSVPVSFCNLYDTPLQWSSPNRLITTIKHFIIS